MTDTLLDIHPGLMGVNSGQLEAAALNLEETGVPSAILKNGVKVTSAQLRKAADILKKADPSICNGVKAERPGFIDSEDQFGEETLVFSVGIIPSHLFNLGRDGEILDGDLDALCA